MPCAAGCVYPGLTGRKRGKIAGLQAQRPLARADSDPRESGTRSRIALLRMFLSGKTVSACQGHALTTPDGRAAQQETTPNPPRAAPPRLEDFPIRVSDLIRYADLDRQ